MQTREKIESIMRRARETDGTSFYEIVTLTSNELILEVLLDIRDSLTKDK